MITVAILTTQVARHELYRVKGEFRIITTRPGEPPTDLQRHEFGRAIPAAEAMEWCETCARCGGVVHRREAGCV
jgi:hypothetical protein